MANYVDVFDRHFQSILPVELLRAGVMEGPQSLTQGREVRI
jgi:hypothetical protein